MDSLVTAGTAPTIQDVARRQPVQEIGVRAFEVLHTMITTSPPVAAPTLTDTAGRVPVDIVLPTRMIRRESHGCSPDPTAPARRRLV